MRNKKSKPIHLWTEKKAALYVRVSTRYQVDKDSLPFQRKKLKEYCKLIGIENFKIFEDDGYSAKNTDRPHFQDMMNRVRFGEFSHIIVWKVDRISRNLLDFAAMYEELKDHRVTFISMNEQFDTSTAIGEAMLKIILIFAELERNMTSERVTGIMLDRAENGLWNGARMPVGFRWNDETKYPEPDPDEVKVVQLIFDEYERTRSCLQVTRYLNNNHVKTKRGGSWSSKLVHDIIRNPFYIGTYRYNMREAGRGPLKPENEWIIKENNHPAIISKEQFDRCNKIMNENAESRDVSGIRKTYHIHVFSGKLICALCGSNMIASKDRVRENGFRPSYYHCSKRARMLTCDNKKIISDLYIGPFIFNYVANLARIQKDFKNGKINSLEKLESALLKGEEFYGIRLANKSLQQTYAALSCNLGKGAYTPDFSVPEKEDNFSIMERRSIMEKEREKCQNAISRLTELYLYDPEALTKEEFSKKKKELTKKAHDIEKQFAEMESVNDGPDLSDLSFIKKASAFLITQRIVTKKHIDYVQMCLDLDNEILKDFIDQVIDQIVALNGSVQKIRFVNGLEHEFIYSAPAESSKCRVCGCSIGKTVSCRIWTISYQGKKYRRVKVGDPGDPYEGKKTGKCAACGVNFGRFHHADCEKEICPICGKQLISCEHGPNKRHTNGA
ncbi:MAG: recombinase family protein [Eubacterium sp.]|nr:recombinase family protein [Eubacterium sp.]